MAGYDEYLSGIATEDDYESMAGDERPRYLPMGFEVTSSAVNQTVQAVATSQEPFRPEKIILSAVNTSGVVDLSGVKVKDIKVGTRSQLVNSNPIPATAFKEDSIVQNEGFHFDIVKSGTDFVMELIIAASGVTVTGLAMGRVYR